MTSSSSPGVSSSACAPTMVCRPSGWRAKPRRASSAHPWPGNIREQGNVIERVALLAVRHPPATVSARTSLRPRKTETVAQRGASASAILPPHARPRIRRASALARSGGGSCAALLPSVGDLAVHRARRSARGIRVRSHPERSPRPSPLARRFPRASRRARHGDACGHGAGSPVGAPALRVPLGRRGERGRLGSLARGAGPGLELARRGAGSAHPARRGGANGGGARGCGGMGARQRGGDAAPGVGHRRLSRAFALPRHGPRAHHRGAR